MRYAPLRHACKDRGQVTHVRHLRADQLVPSGIGDRPATIDEASADDTRGEDLPPEELVELGPPFSSNGSLEIARQEAPAQALLHDYLPLHLDRVPCSCGDLMIDGPEDRQAGGEQDRAAAEGETKHESGDVFAPIGKP